MLQLYQPLASRLSLHDCLTRALERGELWVSGSQAYTSFRSDWIADDDWPAAREAFLNQYPHLTDADVFLEQAKVTLDTHTAAANRVWPDLQDEVWIKDGTVPLFVFGEAGCFETVRCRYLIAPLLIILLDRWLA